MRFQTIFASLIIGVSNNTGKKRNKENDYRYIEIFILVLKTESTLNGLDFCGSNFDPEQGSISYYLGYVHMRIGIKMRLSRFKKNNNKKTVRYFKKMPIFKIPKF